MRYSGTRCGFVAGMVGLALIASSGFVGAVSQGPNNPGTLVNDASVGTSAWTFPGNAATSDDLYAQATPGGVPTQYLKATNFGFSVPLTSVVSGITVAIERRSAAGLITDAAVRIVKGGIIGTADRAAVGTWPTTDTVATYGGPSDLWGETWLPSDLNGGGFGVVLSAGDNVDVAAVDHITVTVHFSVCGDNNVDGTEQCDDGGTVGGDCCSATCQYEGSGSPCAADSDPCTADECDGAGTCGHPFVCSDQPIDGLKLIIKRAASGTEKTVFVSKDPDFLFPPVLGPNDPRTVGAVLEVLTDGEGNASFPMPDTNWTLNGAGTAYKFINKVAPGGPSVVKVSVLKQARVLKMVAKETNLPLVTPLDRVAVRMTTGLLRSCALFEGATILRDEPNRFIAKRAVAPVVADCSNASLGFSPSGAFLDEPIVD